MRAVIYDRNLPVTDPSCLVDVELPVPEPGPRDLLVKVESVSVNPADTKMRRWRNPQGVPSVLGWDVAGTVVTTGTQVSMFSPGDDVFYSGSFHRQGANAEYHVVDERIAAIKPKTLTFAQAAAMPLTALTAWQALFERCACQSSQSSGRSILVMAGAGGVGSIAIQLARALTDLTVVATASRPRSRNWATDMGAHYVVDHTRSLIAQVMAVVPEGIDVVLSSTGTQRNFTAYADILRPHGHIVALDEVDRPDLMLLKHKSLSFHWEMVFTRPMFDMDDQVRQHEILTEVARLLDTSTLRTTMTQDLGPINAATLRLAHSRIESGHTVGKVVLSGFAS